MRAYGEGPVTSDPEIDKLTATVADYPDVLELRVRLITLLATRGRTAEALAQAAEALQLAPDNAEVLAEVARLASSGDTLQTEPERRTEPERHGFDWNRAEAEVAHLIAPEYVDDMPLDTRTPATRTPAPREATRLADVAGMEEVKAQIERSFLQPLRNPELARTYGAIAGGGLLLYGPPGCGKTFIASAIAGELGARLYSVEVPDVVEMATGTTDQDLQQLFATARQSAPAVIFFDEIDAIGQKRSQLRSATVLRQLVTRLLTEIDSSRNAGVFVLGATNHPWDVDSALRRPGRLDRMLFVSPPDEAAREVLVRSNFAGKPIAGIDLAEVVAATAGYSGADVAFLCRTAAQHAMTDSAATGQPRFITMDDVRTAQRIVAPSTAAWFALARNVIEFGNHDGAYDDVAEYLKRSGRRRR